MAKEINGLLTKYDYMLEPETNTPLEQRVIKNFGLKTGTRNRDLASPLGIGRKFVFITYIKWLTAPTPYIIHCDLIDKDQSLSNGKKVRRLS